MIYFTSDTHFGHSNILEYEPLRKEILGNTIAEHNENLIKRINLKVKSSDLLFILGDFSLSSKQEIKYFREKIICENVILVLGNHDKSSISCYYKAGFTFVCHELVLKIAKKYVRLRHHPYRKPWYKVFFPWQRKEKDRKKRPKDCGGWLLHGHTHSQQAQVNKKQINIGVDLNNYYPVSQAQIENIISNYKKS